MARGHHTRAHGNRSFRKAIEEERLKKGTPRCAVDGCKLLAVPISKHCHNHGLRLRLYGSVHVKMPLNTGHYRLDTMQCRTFIARNISHPGITVALRYIDNLLTLQGSAEAAKLDHIGHELHRLVRAGINAMDILVSLAGFTLYLETRPLLPQSFEYEARMYAYGRALVQCAPRGRVEKSRLITHGGKQLRDMGELVHPIFSLLVNIAAAVRELTLDDPKSRAALKEAFPRFPLSPPKVTRKPRGTESRGELCSACQQDEWYRGFEDRCAPCARAEEKRRRELRRAGKLGPTPRRGDRRRKLTPEQVTEIRARIEAGESRKTMAAEYGVCERTMYNLPE